MVIEKEGDDNSEASLKEGVDMRESEQKHIRDHFQITFMQEVVNAKECEWQLH